MFISCGTARPGGRFPGSIPAARTFHPLRRPVLESFLFALALAVGLGVVVLQIFRTGWRLKS